VLDLRCGTGTLTLAMGRAAPDVSITGVNDDPHVPQSLPFAGGCFDHVVSSLVFHHLVPSTSARRWPRRGGSSRPEAAAHRRYGPPAGSADAADLPPEVRALDGMENTRDHAAGRLPRSIEEAGIAGLRVGRRLRTGAGTLEVLKRRETALKDGPGPADP